MPRRPPLATTLLLAAACSGAGSAGAVPVPVVPGVAAAALRTCERLELPDRLLQGQRRRPTSPVSATTAAWGNPPIVLRCGVAAGLAKDDPYAFDGIHWAMHDDGSSRTWTTTGLRVNASVSVPDAYTSQAELLGALAGPLSSLR